MDDVFQTEQEKFWAGEFGTNYINRNTGKELLASNLHFFSNILKGCSHINSVLEFGCNVGMNIQALQLLLPHSSFAGVEINSEAYNQFMTLENVTGFNESIFDFQGPDKYDMTLIKGVLIHINPDMLPTVYEKLYNFSSRYICVAEYYNPTPVTINYRGHTDRLFKRDFASEFSAQYPDVELINYGFAYRKDTLFPQDDISWFLFRK